MTPLWVVWTLRGLAILDALWLVIVFGRTLRAHRAGQFKPRPSTGQGLAGRFLPTVSVVVPSPDGAVGSWVGSISYPRSRIEILVCVPRGVRPRGAPQGSRVIQVAAPGRGALLAAGARAARQEVLVVLPPEFAVGGGFVKRIVAALVDPFIGAAVARVAAGRPGASMAARVDDIDRLGRAGIQIGRHVIGAAVACHREPFAVRRLASLDAGGWDDTHPTPEADMVTRLYARGYAIAYVEEAVALSGAATWASIADQVIERTAGFRRLWRTIRPQLRRSRVLEGPEKTDVRWTTRGVTAPLWILAGWVLVGVLRMVDTSWAPEAIGGVLVLTTFSTVGLAPFAAVSASAVQSRRRTALSLEPWLAPLSFGWLWTGAGAALASPFIARRGRQARRAKMPSQRPSAAVPVPGPEAEPLAHSEPEPELSPQVSPELEVAQPELAPEPEAEPELEIATTEPDLPEPNEAVQETAPERPPTDAAKRGRRKPADSSLWESR